MTSDELRVALAGDSIISGKIKLREYNDDLVDVIRESDVSITNLEAPLHDYDVAASANKRSLYFRSPPDAADELKVAGFDLLAAANNHIGDYSQGGMQKTIEVLEERGIPYAGLGESLSEARAPAFVDTAGSRVALIAATTTYVPGTEAGDNRAAVSGRTGISPLQLRTRYVVTENAFENIRAVGNELGLDDLTKHRSSYLAEDERVYNFLDVGSGTAGDYVSFEQGSEPAIIRTVRKRDVEELLRMIDWATHQADLVIVSVHSHEGANGTYSHRSVPNFLEKLARNCIDEGADAFVSHGPHQIRSIEVYKNKPMFYSVGNFVIQQNRISRFPDDVYRAYSLPESATPVDAYRENSHSKDGIYDVFYEPIQSRSIVPVCMVEDGTVSTVELHPIELGRDFHDGRRGIPRIAPDEIATEIMSDLSQKSEDYDTRLTMEDKVGRIAL